MRKQQLEVLYGQAGIIPLIPESQDAAIALEVTELALWPDDELQVWSYAAVHNPHSIAVDMSGWELIGALCSANLSSSIHTLYKGTFVVTNLAMRHAIWTLLPYHVNSCVHLVRRRMCCVKPNELLSMARTSAMPHVQAQ